MKHLSIGICVVLVLFIGGCATTGGSTPEQQRQSILSMKNEVLTELYKLKPDVKAQISEAPGYAVFSNANVNLILASFGGGYGVVKNNSSGKYTYMKMGELGVGLGLGVKDFRAFFVFHTAETMNDFVEKGWVFGAQADAAAKALLPVVRLPLRTSQFINSQRPGWRFRPPSRVRNTGKTRS